MRLEHNRNSAINAACEVLAPYVDGGRFPGSVDENVLELVKEVLETFDG